MQEEIANLVHSILSHGLSVRDRLEAGVSLNLDTEQAALKGMLTELEDPHLADFGGDTNRARAGNEDGVSFLGIRYALTCWLDEFFILYSPWGNAWAERKLEAALYDTNDRAWKFWQQARLAESRPGNDGLEVFFLGVMLGFRGELGEAPEKLQAWFAATRARLAQSAERGWPAPPALESPTFVPALHARAKLQRMVLVCGLTLLVLIPIVVFFVVRQLGQ